MKLKIKVEDRVPYTDTITGYEYELDISELGNAENDHILAVVRRLSDQVRSDVAQQSDALIESHPVRKLEKLRHEIDAMHSSSATRQEISAKEAEHYHLREMLAARFRGFRATCKRPLSGDVTLDEAAFFDSDRD
jgi:HAMP domain-containing protein